MSNELKIEGRIEGVLEGALYPPHDADSRAWCGGNWCWAIPLLNHTDGIPDEESGRLAFEGETFGDLVRNATKGLKSLGFRGRAYMLSDCWRVTYAKITVGMENVPNGTCDVTPHALLQLEKMGPIGE